MKDGGGMFSWAKIEMLRVGVIRMVKTAVSKASSTQLSSRLFVMKSYPFVLLPALICLSLNGCSKSSQDTDSETPSASTVTASSAPEQVKNAQAEAVRRYPDLGVKNSAFNREFLTLYQQIKSNNPAELNDPQWPIYLADQTAQTLAAATPPPAQEKTPSWFDKEVNDATRVMDVKTKSGRNH